MKLFVFVIFVGCAVNCDESGNYYVIERPSVEPVRELKPFQVYWNVPTMQCKSKKIPFENLFDKYGIIQNQNDSFKGEQITILYDPGLFPAILEEESSGKLRTRNGGVPQEGNLDEHLTAFRYVLDQSIPDTEFSEITILYDPGLFPAILEEESSGKLRTRNGGVPQEGNLDEHLTAFRYVLDQSIPDTEFSGIGIIDFESWRPIFRQNFWGVLTPYRNLSLLIERRLHPWWTQRMIEKEAKFRFERAGREFMQATVALARLLRPQAKWGYYGFPYCFNMAGVKPTESCASNIQKENDQISWLWTESTALYPSVYSSKNLSSTQLAAMIRGRVAESVRVGRGAPVLPYFWFKYRDAGFMSEVDLKAALKAMYKSHASGLIIWGSSNDVNTVSRCEKLKNYLEYILGPEIAKYTKPVYKIDDSHGTSNAINSSNIVTQNPFASFTSNPNADENIQTVDLDSEETNANNSENIQSRLDDEMMSSTNESYKVAEEKNIVIDIVVSLIENVQRNGNEEIMEKTIEKIRKNKKKGTPIHDTFTSIIENDSDFTTVGPLSNRKKKGALFTLLYSNKNIKTTETDEITTTTEGTTTNHNLKSTTVELLYDTDPIPTAEYNQHTFLDEEFNYTTLSQYTNEDSATLDTVSYKEKETTVTIFFDYEMTETAQKSVTEEYYDDQIATETSFTQNSTTETDAYGVIIKESTTNSAFSTTDRTSTVDNGLFDTAALNDDIDDSEYQVVITLE